MPGISFALREFYQAVLPAVIAVVVFAPLYAPLRDVPLERAVAAGVLLGFVTAGAAQTLAGVLEVLKVFNLGTLRDEQAIFGSNWDVNVLRAHLDKDESEKIAFPYSYAVFCKVTAFYLIVYCLLNVAHVAVGVVAGGTLRQGLSVRTPMIGGWFLPSVTVAFASAGIAFALWQDCVSSFDRVFGHNGLYAIYAAKYQRVNKDVARRVWGNVSAGSEGVPRATVTLTVKDVSAPYQTSSREDGAFFFDGVRPGPDFSGTIRVTTLRGGCVERAVAAPEVFDLRLVVVEPRPGEEIA